MRISRNTVATISFVVTDENNKVVGRTDPHEPVVVLVGHGFLVAGLEKAIDGHEKGDEFSCKLNPQEAYGVYDKDLVQEVPRANFGDMELEVGSIFEAETNNGNIAVVIKEIKDDVVVVDGNHPLADLTLNFLVTIEDVREATEEEIAHGHAHPQGLCPSEAHSCGSCGCGGGCSCHEGDVYAQMQDEECCGGHEHNHEGCCGGHGHKHDHEGCCGGHGHGHGHGSCGCKH